MNKDQLGGVIRAAIMLFSGWAASHGFTEESWGLVAGAVGTVIAVLWSLYSNSYGKQVENVARSSDVHEVLVNPGMALVADNPKVVARRSQYGPPRSN